MSTTVVRLGLVGVGRVAQRVHAPILASLPGVELAAIADPSADGKLAARRANPEVALFDTTEQLLEAADVSAVVIALPTHLHASAARAAFAAGKHVYIEKPLAATSTDAQRVLEAHGEAGRIGMTGFNYRYHPLHSRARALVAAGAIGELVAIRSVFATPARDLPTWKRNTSTGGGVMLDLLSHHADLARFHARASVAEVSARVRSIHSDGDNAAVSMTLDSGVIAQCTASMTAAEQDRFELIGSEGALIVDRFGNSLTHLPAKHSATTPEMTGRALRRAFGSLGSLRPAMDPSYRAALAAFVSAIARGSLDEADPTLDDGWASLAAVLAAHRSSDERGSLVSVPARPADWNDASPPSDDVSAATVPREAAAASPDPDAPAISVVLVTIDRFVSLAKVVELLGRQTIADRVQLLLVAPDELTLADLDERVSSRFAQVTPVYVGPITDVDMAAARALPHARAPFIAFLEDHAFPDTNWAEGIVDAFERYGSAGVGTAIENANPGTALSWANMLISYGAWVAAEHAGPTTNVSRHNVAFRADVLREEYGDELPRMMGRDGGLLADLLRRGHSYALQPETRVRHANPSTWRSTLELRLGSGRLFASSRMRRERWSNAKRWLYIIGAPAIPLIRFRLLHADLLGPGSEARRERVGGKAIPALAIACVLDGIGQFLGHAFGPGDIKERLAFFEMGRARHLRSSEKHLMTDPEA